MSAATPGPWLLHERSISTVVAGSRVVAACGGYQDNQRQQEAQDENEANARLIAQAPAMHAALSQIARLQMDGEGGFVLENDDAVDSLHSCIRLARAALAV